MIRIPTFKSCYHVELAEPEGVFLLLEQDYFLLRGERYYRIAPLIDGRRTADDIVDALAGHVAPAEVCYTLNRLQDLGFITEASDASIPTGASAFWELLDVDPRLTSSRLEQATVSVIRIGDFPLEPFECSLDALNIRTGKDGDLSVIVTDDYLREEVRDINTTALASGRPWLMVKPVGAVLWIGPVFRPGITACWECLAHRIRANRPAESYLGSRKKGRILSPVSRAVLPATLHIAYNLAAIETAKLIVEREAQPECRLTTFNCLNWKTQTHTVVRRPQCDRCGHLPSSVPAVVLRSEQSRFPADGGYRTVSPQQTFEQYKHHISPITGAVNRLSRLRIDDNLYMHTYVASLSPVAKNDKLPFSKGLRVNSGGKGTTDAQAKAGALCEALERYSGIFHGDEIRTRASYKQLGDRAIHPNKCMLFSENQYLSRRELNKRQLNAWHFAPDPLNEDAEIEWTPAWSLTKQQTKYLPTSYCYNYYKSPRSAAYCWADSSGNAAGNTLEEAILQGMLELVERDGVALWWYNRVRRPEVDLKCFDEPYIQGVVKYFETIERGLWVLDLSSDLGIPVFAAVSCRNNNRGEEIVFGFGAHLDPRIGVLRAITELNQVLVGATFYYKSVDPALDDSGVVDPLFHDWFKTATLAEQHYLVPKDSAQLVRYSSSAGHGADIRGGVRRCQEILEKKGMEVLVLDQTRPDIRLPVAKVIVPGLRPCWARFAPGRLYDVPVMLDWHPQELAENELNPIPMFL